MPAESTREDLSALISEARRILQQLKEPSMDSSGARADDLLLLCTRLRDGYRIVRSTSARFGISSFAFLNDLLYQLESCPDETLQSAEGKSLAESLLSDLAAGKLVLARRMKDGAGNSSGRESV